MGRTSSDDDEQVIRQRIGINFLQLNESDKACNYAAHPHQWVTLHKLNHVDDDDYLQI